MGAIKAPLCLTYLCPAVRAALEDVAGPGCCGEDEENFCGSADALHAVIAEPLEEAEGPVAALEARLRYLARCLEHAGIRCGRDLLNRWLGRSRMSRRTTGEGENHP